MYAAIGIPIATYIYNRTWYHNCQEAVSIIDTYADSGYTAVPDTVISKLRPKIQPFGSLFKRYALPTTGTNTGRTKTIPSFSSCSPGV